MKRKLFTLSLLVIAANVHAGEFWSKLWRNADQQGEALMQQGDAGNAAKVYADPHRRAYAKINAGDYQGAAKELNELHDSDADYNRGNALAHAGDLQGALDAYEAAIKSNPDNQDAKHNRELVASALKQQPPQQQKSGDKKSQDEQKDGQQGKQENQQGGKDGQDKNEQSKDAQGKNEQGKSGQADNKPGKGQDSSGNDNNGQQPKPGQQDKEGKSQDGKLKDEKPGQDKQAGQGKNGQQAQPSLANNKPTQADNKTGQNQQAAKDDAEQARRDVEASLGKPGTEGKKGEAVNAAQATAAPPKSEKQIAQEQWLRSIPEDPGGLLRRKFLIEHMMKQQKAQQ